MFLVVRNWMGEVQFSKEDIDPRSRMSYKQDKQTIHEIVNLTPAGAALSLPRLKAMYLDNLFDVPSRYKEVEKPKVAAPKKPPKELMGPKE